MGYEPRIPSGGATIPSVTNLIKGDGTGNGVDSGIAASNVALLAATNTFTQNQIFSAAVAASTPVMKFTGALYTGGNGTTTLPVFLHQPTGVTAATDWDSGANHGAIFGANEAAGYVGKFCQFKVDGAGVVSITTGAGNFGAFSYPDGSGNILSVGTFTGNAWASWRMALSKSSGITTVLDAGNNVLFAFSPENVAQGFQIQSKLGFAATGGFTPLTSDTWLIRKSAAVMQLGLDAASPVNQQFMACGARVGTDTNGSPGNALTISGPNCTGTGTGGNIAFGVYGTNGASGTAIGTLNTLLTLVAARKTLNIAGVPTSSAGLSTGDIYSNAGILTVV